MHLLDLHLNRYGILQDVSLSGLSPGITVFWGPNGCGKTTVVQFLRSLLFGFRSSSLSDDSVRCAEGGSLRFRSAHGLRSLYRTRQVPGDETFRVTESLGDLPAGQQDNHLPAWVREDIFREVFSPGYDEADRFELLTRCCLEAGTSSAVVESEIAAAELSIQQAVRERDGHGAQPGISQRIAELRRRQQEWQQQLSSLRKPSAELPDRIQEVLREIELVTQRMQQNEHKVAEIEREIQRLQTLLVELRNTGRLPLDRLSIEGQVRQLTGRLERWRSIREAMLAETSDVVADSRPAVERPATEALLTIRSILSRIEDRVQQLAVRSRSDSGTDTDGNPQDSALRQLTAETAALCRYLGQHEQSVTQHQESLEQFLAYRSIDDAARMIHLLEDRISGLKRELTRADNVMDSHARAAAAADAGRSGLCQHAIHRDADGHGYSGNASRLTIEEVEHDLVRLVQEKSRLQNELIHDEETRRAKRAALERLRSELAAAGTLEQIDGLRAQIAELDAQVVLLEDRRKTLDQTEHSMRELIERLKLRCHPGVLELATQYIARLTEGECRQILVSGQSVPQLLIQTSHHTEPLPIPKLSRGTRHQLALALRLALIRVRRETNGHVPLILDDVFITSDDHRATAVVQLLTEMAADGQQILFFTCQKDVRDLFLKFHADVRTFDGHLLPAEPAPVLKAFVEEVRVSPPVVTIPAEPEPVSPVAPQPITAAPAIPAGATNWLFYLEVDQDVDDLAGITLNELEALRAAGVRTIDGLLSHSAGQLEELTRRGGYLLSAERLQALRGQAELTCRVPMLRRSDAALLYAAGIRSAEELGALRPETVFDRVTAFQRTEIGGRFRRAGRLIDRQQAINWSRWGQHTRSLEDARLTRSRFSVRPLARSTSDSENSSAAGTPTSGRLQRRERLRSSTGSLSRRRPLVSEPGGDSQRKAQRLARQRRLAARRLARDSRTQLSPDGADAPAAVERPVAMTTHAGRSLRFFLSRSSLVESAPSIGPKTAESLNSCGIRKVDDLLSASAERLSQQLSQRRITTAVIQQWQAQARLMCQVPELRGHDVQLLVACGVTDPDDLARRKPSELLALVLPFAESREGERILRNAKKPDLTEVTDWVGWAGSARSFRAA